MIGRFLIAALSLQAALSIRDTTEFCPRFSATFAAMIDEIIDDADYLLDDTQLTFFKEILGFRDETIQHVFDDAFKFFNETYGLDFSLSPQNDQHEYVFENAKLSLFRFPADINYLLLLNNWIQTGNTHTTCREIHDGGIRVRFSGDQLLHGSYGGVAGIPAGVGDALIYGFSQVDVCDQSPVTIQFHTPTPFRQEPIDGSYFLNFDLYNQVLGHGKAIGTFSIKPDEDHPGKFRFVSRVVYTF